MIIRFFAIVFILVALVASDCALANSDVAQSADKTGNTFTKKAYIMLGGGLSRDNWHSWVNYDYAPITEKSIITHINHQWNALATVGLGYYFNPTFSLQLDYLKPFDNGWDYQRAGKPYHSVVRKYVVDLMAHVTVPIYKAYLYAGFGVAYESQDISSIDRDSRYQLVPAIEFGDYYYLNSHIGAGLSYKHLFNLVGYTSVHYMPASDYFMLNLLIK